MDFVKFCSDYRIPIAPVGHKHYRKGWVNISCPFCNSITGYHLGCTGFFFTCYRCGEKGQVNKLIRKLLGINYNEAQSIVIEYGGGVHVPFIERKVNYRFQENIKPPCLLDNLSLQAAKYLHKRGFNAPEIATKWHVSQTSPIGQYSGRLFIPVYFQGFLVSYTCRSYINDPLKYLSCKKENEAIPHKHILYGLDKLPDKRKIVVVEGCFDVWKLGYGAVATFGTKVTPQQKNILMEFDKIILLADGDEAGYKAWSNLGTELTNNGKKVKMYQMPDGQDAADFTFEEAISFMRQA